MPDLPLDFVERMVKLAEKTGQRMSETNEGTIDNAEITFGVWRDPAQPRGIGLMGVGARTGSDNLSPQAHGVGTHRCYSLLRRGTGFRPQAKSGRPDTLTCRR